MDLNTNSSLNNTDQTNDPINTSLLNKSIYSRKPRQDSKPEQPNKKQRYCESDFLKQFLNSPQGISFLIDKGNNSKIQNILKKKEVHYSKIFEDVLDFYLTWAEMIPIRSDNMCVYQLFKQIEKCCEKKEVKALFNYLFVTE